MVSWSDDSIHMAAPPTNAAHSFIAGIREITARLGVDAPDVAARLRKIAGAIEEEQVTVNFGGVFNAGKSTMMNAVVGRDILPVDDMPDTGAICCLLGGEEDSAVVVEDGARRPIPCTTDSIRAEITLLTAQGERRGEVAAIDRAEIVLKDCVIPRAACWVDSPGYNDTAEMDARTLRSAAYADVLAWVLTSRQLLSQVEMEFLSGHVRESGPASVVFILNGFLRTDTTAEWGQFLAKSAPQLINKVQHFAPDMGFPEQAPPAIIPVAGRAMCKSGQDSFGGSELVRFMVGVDSRFHPRVMRTRLWRASAGLRDCAAKLDEPIARAAEEIERRKIEVAEGNRRAEGKRRLAESLDKVVEQFVEEFSTGARACSTDLASRMTNVAAASGGIHAAQLNQGIVAVAEAAARRMIERLGDTLRRTGELPLNQEWMTYFVSLTRPPATALRFREQIEAGGVDAVVAAIPAFLGEKLGRPPQWLATVRSELQRVTEGIVAAMQSRRARFSEGFDRLYSLQAAELPAPDESALRRLQELRERLREAAVEASKLAAPAEPAAAPRGWRQGLDG
jgi:Dynamin family